MVNQQSTSFEVSYESRRGVTAPPSRMWLVSSQAKAATDASADGLAPRGPIGHATFTSASGGIGRRTGFRFPVNTNGHGALDTCVDEMARDVPRGQFGGQKKASPRRAAAATHVAIAQTALTSGDVGLARAELRSALALLEGADGEPGAVTDLSVERRRRGR